MMERLLTALVDGLTRGPFTAKKLGVVLALAIAGGVAVVVYEIQTANFALYKYARAAAILKDLEEASTSTNVGIASAAGVVADRVGELLAETGADPSLSETDHRVALALIVGLPCLVMSIVGVVEGLRREPDWQYGLFGCLALALVLGGVAFGVPTEMPWFYRYVLFPLAVYAGLVALFLTAEGEDDETEDAA